MRAERPVAHAPRASRVAGASNRLRIIGGEWRSRIVRFPASAGLRPTPDRVRETLFNWLGQRLDGLDCVDLFAGSGALGLEARSRGAAHVVLVERDREAALQLRRTAADLGEEGIEVVHADVLDWLRRGGRRFDVAFVDPPYASGLLQPALAALEPHLCPGARVYVESSSVVEAPAPAWACVRAGAAGAVRFALFTFDAAAAPQREG